MLIFSSLGEEICDCYIDLRQSKKNRRKELLDNFRFYCGCVACSSGECSSGECSSEENLRKTMVDQGKESDTLTNNITDPTVNNKIEDEDLTDKDDYYREYSLSFEDSSIDSIIEGNTPKALLILYKGLAILEMEQNMKWSVRYLSSAHLSIYQILCKINNDYSNNNNNVHYNNDKTRNRNEDTIITNDPTKLSSELSLGSNEDKMRYHLERAHAFNIQVQGPHTPDSCSTKKLMKKHNFL
jgi:hypothetical protein